MTLATDINPNLLLPFLRLHEPGDPDEAAIAAFITDQQPDPLVRRQPSALVRRHSAPRRRDRRLHQLLGHHRSADRIHRPRARHAQRVRRLPTHHLRQLPPTPTRAVARTVPVPTMRRRNPNHAGPVRIRPARAGPVPGRLRSTRSHSHRRQHAQQIPAPPQPQHRAQSRRRDDIRHARLENPIRPG